MKRILIIGIAALSIACTAAAQSLKLPATVEAGSGLAIPTSGSGDATLYVYGPGTAIKKKFQLGRSIELAGDEVKAAGRYTVILKGGEKGGEDASGTFAVVPANLDSIAFLARPSRVPASRRGGISGSAYLFDAYKNLVVEPTPVKFQLDVEGGVPVTRTVTSKNGVAWARMDSGKKAGTAQFEVTADNASVKRVVQETAADPCNLRMHAQPDKDGSILVETDPIKDCSGNPVPDGTIVTFTSADPSGRSTVDARIKQGVAKAELPASQKALLSVAAGVVMGNEIHWGGGK